jgi:hypothetical protein
MRGVHDVRVATFAFGQFLECRSKTIDHSVNEPRVIEIGANLINFWSTITHLLLRRCDVLSVLAATRV